MHCATFLLGNADDPIDLIQKYEEDFFRDSKLFRYEDAAVPLDQS